MLDFDQQGHIVTLTINRPDMRNALGEPGDGGVFSDAVARINDDRNMRCVILTGAGSAFSAGGNIKAMQKREGPFAGSPAHIADGYRRGIHQIVKSLWGWKCRPLPPLTARPSAWVMMWRACVICALPLKKRFSARHF